MASIKGITVEIGGDTVGLQNALKDVNKRSRELTSELREVDRALKFNPGNVELMAQRQQLLTEQVENTTNKLNQLREAQAQVERQFADGEIDEGAYRAFQRELITTESRLNHYTNQLRELEEGHDQAGDSAEEAGRDIDSMGDDAQQAEGKLSKLGSGAKTALGVVAGAAAAGAAAIGGLVTGMEDMNKEMARLRTNADVAGFSIAGVESAFKDVASITGDTGAAVETVSNLMQTGFSDNQLAQVVNEINGAYIAFSDTLSTEGIADGIQETFGVGEAAGSFLELLERSGQDVEKFNEGLAQAAKNGTETDYVLQALAETGLAANVEAYKELNPELVAQQEAQIALQMALSKLSVALTPLVTMVTEFLTKIVEWGNENLVLVKSFDSIGEGLAALLPQVHQQGLQIVSNIVDGIHEMLPEFIATVQTIVPKAVENLKAFLPDVLNTGIEILLTLVNGIIQMLPTLIQSAVELVVTIVRTLLDNLPKILDMGVKILESLIDGIVKVLPSLISTALKLVVEIATTIVKNLPKIIDVGIKLLTALINGILSMVGELANTVMTDIIPSIVDTLSEVDLMQIGKDIIQGLIDGITAMADVVWKKVKEIADNIKETMKDALGIHSPSRVMMEIGKHTVDGLTAGIDKSMSSVTSATNQMANALMFDSASTGAAGIGRPINVVFDVDGETLASKLVRPISEEIVLTVGRW